MTSSTPYVGNPSDDLVPINDRRNAKNVKNHPNPNSDDVFNLATAPTSRHLINGSFTLVASSSSSDSLSSSSLKRRLETQLRQSKQQNPSPPPQQTSSINSNLRHSILIQSSSGPKYELSNSDSSAASNIFFDEDIRDSETAEQFNNKDKNGHSNLPPIDQSNLAAREGSNLNSDVLPGTSETSFTSHHKHQIESNDPNGQGNSPLSSSASSSLPNSFHHSRPHPFVPALNSQSESSKAPLIVVSVSTSDSNDEPSNVDTRKIHIHDLVPRRRPPKRLELPIVPTSLLPTPIATSYSTSTSARMSISSRSHDEDTQSLPLAFFSHNEPNSTKRLLLKQQTSGPVRGNNNNNNNNNGHRSSNSLPLNHVPVTSTARPIPSSHLFPEDGRPFGLLDYETLIGDSESDFDGQTRPVANTEQRQVNNRKPSINPSNISLPSILTTTATSSASFNSFDSTSMNSGESVGPRINESPSDHSGSQLTSSIANPAAIIEKCNSSNCKLPNCNCGSARIPNGMKLKDVPQIVLLTFDDAVNELNWDIYEQIFNSGRKNPNGCPILGTFYVSHEWTDYSQVQTLYSRGHEIASHGITHSFGEKFTKNQWLKEIDGQRQILNAYAGVKLQDVRGMRAPFLQIGGNKQFEMLLEANFTYDSSMPIFENDPPYYPYTLDHPISHECMIAPCPSKSFPGLWEVGLVMYQDLQGGRCSMADACQNPSDAESVFKMLLKNFNRHYKSNRAPFGLFYHSAWFNTQHHFKGFLNFLDHILTKSDVYFTTNWQMIQWMKKPTSLGNLKSTFTPWNCNSHERPVGECLNPHVCTVKHKEGSRFMKTCQTCPIYYPWVGRIA